MVPDYEVLDLIQGSDEWLKVRRNYRCASETAVVLGIHPYVSKKQLWHEKKGIQQPTNDYKEFLLFLGIEGEAEIRKKAEEEFYIKANPITAARGRYLASVDIFDSPSGTMIEAKTSTHKVMNIPEFWKIQVAVQMHVLKPHRVFFGVKDTDGVEFWPYTPTIYSLEDFDKAWEKFEVLLERDEWLPSVDTNEWNTLADEYLFLLDSKNEAETRMGHIKERLAEISPDGGVGGGVELKKIVRKGNIDYAQAQKIFNIPSFEPFRGKEIEYYSLSREKTARA